MNVPTHIINLKKAISDSCNNDTVLSKMGHHRHIMHEIDIVGWNVEAKEAIENMAKNRVGRYKDFKYDTNRMQRILDRLIGDFDKEHVSVFLCGRDIFGGYDDLDEDLVYRCEDEKANSLQLLPFDCIETLFKERPLMSNIGYWQQIYGKIALIEVLCSELLKPIPEPIEQPKEKTVLESLTNNQTVLIFYYFFKFSKLEPRVDTDISSIAKFLHLITGKNFTTIQNSDFYTRLMKAPNFKKDTELAKDLIIIRDLFERVELKGIVQMIDNELVTVQNERNNK